MTDLPIIVDSKEFVSDVDLIGYVKVVDRSHREKNKSIFTVETTKNQICVKVICPFFCPVAEGDIVSATGVGDAKVVTLTRSPLVRIGTDIDFTITGCFHKALSRTMKITNVRTNRIFQLLDLLEKTCTHGNLLDSKGDLIDTFLNHTAEDYQYARSESILEQFSSVLNASQAQTLLKWWFRNRCLRRLYLFGLTLSEIRLCEIRPSVIYDAIMQNPYILAPIEMDKCKNLLQLTGRTPTENQLSCGQLIRWLYRKCKDGNSYLPVSKLSTIFPDIDINDDKWKEYGVSFEGPSGDPSGDPSGGSSGRVYFTSILANEKLICDVIANLKREVSPRSPDIIQGYVNRLRTEGYLSEDQINAVVTALSNRVSIISGSAGSGKTSTMSVIVDLLTNEQKNILIVSFTGKAIARISQVFGSQRMSSNYITVSTIHRFLASWTTEHPVYDHIFIDETSMVNCPLLAKFMSKIDYSTCFTFIGDNHQLSPIDWSGVFDPLINCKVVSHQELSTIHRTSAEVDNGILANSMLIRNWRTADKLEIKKYPNFQMAPGDMKTVKEVVKCLLGAGQKLDNIVILSPYNRDLNDLNNIMRSFLPGGGGDGGNSGSDTVSVTDRIARKNWRVGDRVILTKNNYEIRVMNGEEGKVKSITPSQILVTFIVDGTEKEFPFNLDESINDDVIMDEDSFSGALTTRYLAHSFAITIHKSQGSEYPVVILYISPSSTTYFLDNRLIYTAVTRAKRGIIIVGNITNFLTGASTAPKHTYNSLTERLDNACR